MRATLPCLLIIAIAPLLPGQSFDVASIKPADPAEQAAIDWTGTQLNISDYSPRMLIEWAWDIRSDRLFSESKWLDTARFNIVAKPAKAPEYGQLQLMMRSLLADRFGLVVHHETRDLTFYVLIADRNGPKVKLSDPGPNPPQNSFRMSEPGHLSGTNVSMAMLANVLSSQLGRTVRDSTGLNGIFDFALAWSPDMDTGLNAAGALPSIFTAVGEQLGLKLESRKGPVDALVVDRIASAPTAN